MSTSILGTWNVWWFKQYPNLILFLNFCGSIQTALVLFGPQKIAHNVFLKADLALFWNKNWPKFFHCPLAKSTIFGGGKPTNSGSKPPRFRQVLNWRLQRLWQGVVKCQGPSPQKNNNSTFLGTISKRFQGAAWLFLVGDFFWMIFWSAARLVLGWVGDYELIHLIHLWSK